MSTGHFPLMGGTGNITKQLTAADMKEEVIPMIFPGGKSGKEQVRLALQNGNVIIFNPGVQNVPKSLAEFGEKKELHPWLKAHGVVPVAPGTPVQTQVVATSTVGEQEKPPEQETDANKPPAEDAGNGSKSTAAAGMATTAFNALTKADLALWAKTNLGLELDPENMKKDEMVAAVVAAQQKKEAQQKG